MGNLTTLDIFGTAICAILAVASFLRALSSGSQNMNAVAVVMIGIVYLRLEIYQAAGGLLAAGLIIYLVEKEKERRQK